MADHVVNVQVDEVPSDNVDVSRIHATALAVLTTERPDDDAELTVAIVGDAEIQALNRQYSGIDAPTDVLSFSAQEGQGFVLPDEESRRYLGDVLISLPTATGQAAALGHSVAEEMDLLVVHGCLHLLGYDHADDVGQAQMWARQSTILDGL